MAAGERRRAPPAGDKAGRNGADSDARGGRGRASTRTAPTKSSRASEGRRVSRDGAGRRGESPSSSGPEGTPGGLAGLVQRRARQWSLDSIDPSFAHRQRPFWNLLQDHYFRMEIEGWHRLPDPPALVVGTHAAGIFPVEAWMFGLSWWRRFGEDRILHGTAHDALMAAPGFGAYFRRMGVMSASRETVSAALEAGRDVAVFPGGDVDSLRPWLKRDRVMLAGRTGFVKQAIRSGVPIVPLAQTGGSDTMFTLTDGKRLARALRLNRLARAEALPLALGVPWGIAPGVLPFLPLPAKLRSELLEPLFVDDDPERADDDDYVEEVYREVERRLQGAMSRLASRRSFPVLG
ncbi:MAG TPA: lysophospholipid acyltransferase family protein [Thermoleophilaceae bacterium]|nr:lysophospholipid acyltransferase family protein [Thermoleophilaceae bacterium]